VQALPALQLTQLPAEQTMFEPQLVPLAWLPDSTQRAEPVAHEVVPVRHGVVGVQAEPAAHATQVPLLQTLSVPQPAPLASALPVSVQLIEGEQTVMPAWHGLAGVQAEPAAHAAQLPPLQTMLAPQTVPLGASVDSMQMGVPVLHAMVPRRHGFPATVQSMPATHAPHAPLALQTWSVPHAVPAATFVPVSAQVGAAPEQTSVPVWHLLVGVQAPPIWQVAQVPAWQTMPLPHVVPFGLLSTSVQTGAPVVQAILPTRQGLPVGSHAMSAVQLSQLPLWQTMFMPHSVPLASVSVSSMHDLTPPSRQTNVPLWHTFPGTQSPPGTHIGASGAEPSGLNTPVPPAPAIEPPPEPPPTPAVPPSLALTGRRRNPPQPAANPTSRTMFK
jgi:hypothetical protein